MRSDQFAFLSVGDVKRLHFLSISKYGGSHGVRDEGLLESALEMPSQTFGGELLHQTLGAIAGAYLFHLCQNHAFLDGNKRVGLLSCETFLRLNGYELTLTSEEAERTTLAVAGSILSKEALLVLIERSIRQLEKS